MQDSKRQLQKEQTRRKIIDAAFKIYSENGFSAATSAIAKEAGLAHGSVFLHFPSLNDLLACLLKEFGDSLTLRLHDLSRNSGTIEDLLGAYIDALSEHEKFYFRLITETSLLP
ncbi:MAG: TetR/AcrR family transcriptional regulator, partial [Synergistaceae bacterium]|nr:TetR/AcrR family transcriptional regulator [Synergistaceae bacterium]